MSDLKPIDKADFERVILASKSAGSGIILIETPAAAHQPDRGQIFLWESTTGDESAMMRILSTLSGDSRAAAEPAQKISRKLASQSPDMINRDPALRDALQEIRDEFARGIGSRRLLVRFASLDSFDPLSSLLMQKILDHPDQIAVSFLLPCELPHLREAASDERDIPRLYRLLELCVQIKMWNRAEIVLKGLLRDWSRIADRGIQGLIAFRAGMVEVRKGHLEEAARQYENALRHLDAAGDRDTLVKVLNNLGNIRLQENRADEAALAFARAVALGEELQSDYHLSVTYGNFAHLMLQEGRPEEGLENLRKSFVFTARSGYYRHAHYSYSLMADCFAELGREQEAQVAYEKAIRICELEDNVPDGAQIRLKLGRFLLARGRVESAGTVIRESEAVYRRLNHGYGLMNSLEALSEWDRARGDRSGAHRRIEEALAQAHSIGDRQAQERIGRLRDLAAK